MNRALLRFYAELNDFLPRTRRQVAFQHEFQGTPSIKDLVESLGVPHGEIDLILANGASVDFSWKVPDGARISVFPVFEALDIGPLTRVRPAPLRETRFLLDEHLGRLARYLRMAGLDTRWQNRCGDETLVQVAVEEHRILLTRDRGLLMRREVSHGYWVRETDPRRQLEEVLERFDLFRSLRQLTAAGVGYHRRGPGWQPALHSTRSQEPSQPMTTDPRKLEASAAEWTAKGDFSKAVEAWREVTRLDPQNLGAQQKLAEVLHGAGEDAQAVEVYRALADAYAQGGQPIKAIALGKAIREIDTQNQEAQQALASLYARRAPQEAGGRAADLEIEIDEQPPTPIDPLAGTVKESATAFEGILSAASRGRATAGVAREEAGLGSPGAAPSVQAPAEPIRAPVLSLPHIPLFSELSREAFVALTERVEMRYARKDEAILTQGETGNAFFVLVWGQARVERRDETGETIVLAHLGEGAFFGEMALLSGAPRAATVIAEEDTELLEIRAEVLHQLCLEHPQVAEALKHFYRQRLLANLFATSPLFRPFGAQECRDIMERFFARPMRAGERIIQEGRPSDGLYVVLSGSVDVKKLKDGREVLAGHLAEGDVFGEMSCLSGGPASATIAVHRPGILLRLPRQAFDALVSAHPQMRDLFSQLSDERALSLEAILDGHAEFTEEGLLLI